MQRMVLGSTLLMVTVLAGCTTATPEGGGDNTRRPTVTETRTPTATESRAPTVTETRTRTETKAPPPPEPQRTEAPPENPAPTGPADTCSYTNSRPDIKAGATG